MNITGKCSNNPSGNLVVVGSTYHCELWRWQNGRYSTTAFPSVCFEEYRTRKMNKPMAPANVAIPRITPTTMFISKPMQRRCVLFKMLVPSDCYAFRSAHLYFHYVASGYLLGCKSGRPYFRDENAFSNCIILQNLTVQWWLVFHVFVKCNVKH